LERQVLFDVSFENCSNNIFELGQVRLQSDKLAGAQEAV